jgi:hypothetical protein
MLQFIMMLLHRYIIQCRKECAGKMYLTIGVVASKSLESEFTSIIHVAAWRQWNVLQYTVLNVILPFDCFPTHRPPLLPQDISLVLISVGGLVDHRVIVRPKGLSQRTSNTSSEIEPATFLLAQHCHRAPQINTNNNNNNNNNQLLH